MGQRRNGDRAELPQGGSAETFGQVLRHLRKQAGYTQAELAAEMHCDRSLLARFEAGTRVPDERAVRLADEFLGAGGLLVLLWARTDWYPEVQHPDWFKRRAQMDSKATAIFEYQSVVMPGLLQTHGYAFAQFAQVKPLDEVEGAVRARLSRQGRFIAPGGPLLVVVLDESCITNVVGDAQVMSEQCNHLLIMGALPNIRIQVAPADAPHIVRPLRPMSIIHHPDGTRCVYSESLDQGHFVDEPGAVTRHGQTYDVLRADALSASESAAMIRAAMEGYDQHGEPRPRRGNVAQEQLQRQQRRQLRRNRLRPPRRRARP
ncbi:Scr1 family TA system antitoxin-like transcriptional regulator [Streptomyces sp. NPDC007088]|uniref:helix-turn-helix domain-containing protein n=1 Tax=Streptomyces sp. NPDC007088 TaxID=3364773 RepID=UPI0036C41211